MKGPIKHNRPGHDGVFNDRNWPSVTHLVLPKRGGDLALKPQNADIQDVVRRAMQIMTDDLLFDDAFPQYISRANFSRPALVKAAKEADTLASREICKRLEIDDHYAQLLGNLVRSLL